MGASASGPMGSLVAGLSGGNGLFGMSATMLYQRSGISLSSRVILVCFMASGSLPALCVVDDPYFDEKHCLAR